MRVREGKFLFKSDPETVLERIAVDNVSDDTISGQRGNLVLGEAQPGAGQQLQVGVCLLTLSPACSLVLTLDLIIS